MPLTGYGTGPTPEAAAADTRRDLSEQIAMLRFGNFVAQGVGGAMALAATVFVQGMMRPVPTLVVGLAGWVGALLLWVLVEASLPEHPLGQVLLLVGGGLVAAQFLAPLAAAFAVACTHVEVVERRLIRGLPEVPRRVIVTVTSLVPMLFAAGGIAATLREAAATGVAPGWFGILFFVVLGGVLQVASIVARQRTGAVLGDYDWLGRRMPAPAAAEA